MKYRKGLAVVAASLFVLACAGPADAARARFHYTAADPTGRVPWQRTPGVTGVTGVGTFPCQPPCTTCVKCFQHPYSGQTVMLPLGLPEGTPVIYHRGINRISYNYGSYVVEVYFMPDGSVDVVYNSGLLRRL